MSKRKLFLVFPHIFPVFPRIAVFLFCPLSLLAIISTTPINELGVSFNGCEFHLGPTKKRKKKEEILSLCLG
jgi:hypothetical protein